MLGAQHTIEAVGAYRIVRKLGEGGMGAVYEGVHTQIGRRAAIKLLHPEHSSNQELLTRFFNEARAVNIVQHPSLVNIYEFGKTPEGAAYIIMEYLAGESLRARLKGAGGKIGSQSIPIARQIATALAATHAKRITHRDLKPDNVMLVPDPEVKGGERVKILDFGIAKLAGEPSSQDPSVRTRTGAIMGTPVYMAPEQCRGNTAVEEHADVYSLGVMLFEMVAGRPPFLSDAFGELVAMHLFAQPPSLRQVAPEAPETLVQLVQQMLAKAVSARPDMLDVAQRLGKLAEEPDAGFGAATSVPVTGIPMQGSTTMRYATGQRTALSPRRWRMAGVVGLLVVFGGGLSLFWRRQERRDPLPPQQLTVPAARATATEPPRAPTAAAAQKPPNRTPDGELESAVRECLQQDRAGPPRSAVTACKRALVLDPGQAEVQQALSRAEAALVRKPVVRAPVTPPSPVLPPKLPQQQYKKVQPLD